MSVLTEVNNKKNLHNNTNLNTTELPIENEKLILALKITTVVLTTLALLAAAGVIGFFAWPLLAESGVLFACGIAFECSAVGIGLTAISSPCFNGTDDERGMFDNTPMFRATKHNFSDCTIYVGKCLLASVAIGILPPGLLFGAAIIMDMAKSIFKGPHWFLASQML